MPPLDRDNEITFFAETNYRGQRRRFGIRRRDRRAHMYLIGRTGTGKSTLLEALIASDLEAGNGLALLDPHGDLASKVRSQIPAQRAEDFINFDPANHPISYNPLRVTDLSRRYLVASGLVSAFRKVWSESWGPRMEHILRHALLTLAEFPGSTLLDLPRLLTDPPFRRAVVGRVTDEQVRAFWAGEFERYAGNFRNEAIAPILNKIGAVLASPVIRQVVGERGQGVDLREVMDGGKVLIVNLSKGRLGEDAASLLGALLIAGFEQAALGRVDTPEADRPDFYLYIDEMQNFATLSLAAMLQEARKYRLGLVMVGQFLDQLDEQLQGAILGNVGTLIAFRVGVRDAKVLADEFFPEFTVEDLVSLARGHIYLRLMIDGVVSRGFSARTIIRLFWLAGETRRGPD
jgi:type IV secretory pathway TraG/TraD family ATPase VirD4